MLIILDRNKTILYRMICTYLPDCSIFREVCNGTAGEDTVWAYLRGHRCQRGQGCFCGVFQVPSSDTAMEISHSGRQ